MKKTLLCTFSLVVLAFGSACTTTVEAPAPTTSSTTVTRERSMQTAPSPIYGSGSTTVESQTVRSY